jgi:hypothetical protein
VNEPWSGNELTELLAKLKSPAVDEAMRRQKPTIDDAYERMESKSRVKKTKAAIDYFEAIEAVIKEANSRDAREKEIDALLNSKRPIADTEARIALRYLRHSKEQTRHAQLLDEFYYARRMKAALRALAGLSAIQAEQQVERRLGISYETLRKRSQRSKSQRSSRTKRRP